MYIDKTHQFLSFFRVNSDKSIFLINLANLLYYDNFEKTIEKFIFSILLSKKLNGAILIRY